VKAAHSIMSVSGSIAARSVLSSPHSRVGIRKATTPLNTSQSKNDANSRSFETVPRNAHKSEERIGSRQQGTTSKSTSRHQTNVSHVRTPSSTRLGYAQGTIASRSNNMKNNYHALKQQDQELHRRSDYKRFLAHKSQRRSSSMTATSRQPQRTPRAGSHDGTRLASGNGDRTDDDVLSEMSIDQAIRGRQSDARPSAPSATKSRQGGSSARNIHADMDPAQLRLLYPNQRDHNKASTRVQVKSFR
jgi:hypothetical protein